MIWFYLALATLVACKLQFTVIEVLDNVKENHPSSMVGRNLHVAGLSLFTLHVLIAPILLPIIFNSSKLNTYRQKLYSELST